MKSTWNQKVWNLVKTIPRGKVASYGQLAGMLGQPRKARHVGYALHQTPEDLVLPWHRVINAQGRISFSEHSQEYLMQKAMLEAEKVTFQDGNRIDMKVYGWRPK
ncbi:MAG: methylated-DNA--[protein]-cysteine S-methyltransferase [Acidobacteriota bacterium]|nr:methylated-DNA--[protein]-cysteine S-methyltransferase [Acidobacteriota bacterium]